MGCISLSSSYSIYSRLRTSYKSSYSTSYTVGVATRANNSKTVPVVTDEAIPISRAIIIASTAADIASNLMCKRSHNSLPEVDAETG